MFDWEVPVIVGHLGRVLSLTRLIRHKIVECEDKGLHDDLGIPSLFVQPSSKLESFNFHGKKKTNIEIAINGCPLVIML